MRRLGWIGGNVYMRDCCCLWFAVVARDASIFPSRNNSVANVLREILFHRNNRCHELLGAHEIYFHSVTHPFLKVLFMFLCIFCVCVCLFITKIPICLILTLSRVKAQQQIAE